MISFLLNIFFAFLGFCFVFLFINDTRVSEESFSQSFTLVSFFSPYLLFHSSFVFILLIKFNKSCHVFFLLLFCSSHSIFSLFSFSPTFILFSFYSLLLRFCKKKKKKKKIKISVTRPFLLSFCSLSALTLTFYSSIFFSYFICFFIVFFCTSPF